MIAVVLGLVLALADRPEVMIWLLWLLAQAPTPGYVRTYYPVRLEQVATTSRTHICTVGPVVYVRRQKDADWHITLDNGKARIVVEVIPLIPVAVPRKGQMVRACGITRFDKAHRWYEIHPVERLEVLASVKGEWQ